MLLRILVATAAFLAHPLAVHAAVITQWNFNTVPADGNTTTGTLIPSSGIGTPSLVGGTTSMFASGDVNNTSTDPVTGDDSAWNVTTFPTQSTGDRTRGVQFNVGTSGFKDITLSWDQRNSNTASRYSQLQYTTDGTTWIDFATPFDNNAADTWFNSRSVNLSAIGGVNNNPLFGFRILAVFAPSTTSYAPTNAGSTYGAAGTWRFDMVTVNGTALEQVTQPIPAPVGVWIFAGVVLTAFRFRGRGR